MFHGNFGHAVFQSCISSTWCQGPLDFSRNMFPFLFPDFPAQVWGTSSLCQMMSAATIAENARLKKISWRSILRAGFSDMQHKPYPNKVYSHCTCITGHFCFYRAADCMCLSSQHALLQACNLMVLCWTCLLWWNLRGWSEVSQKQKILIYRREHQCHKTKRFMTLYAFEATYRNFYHF